MGEIGGSVCVIMNFQVVYHVLVESYGLRIVVSPESLCFGCKTPEAFALFEQVRQTVTV